MKKMLVKIRDLAEEKLRGVCAGLSPEKRVITIVVLTVLFALGNFYMIFRAIYDIGREDAKREVIEITPLDIPDFIQADTLTDSKIREMEEFFNQFNKEGRETRSKKKRPSQNAETVSLSFGSWTVSPPDYFPNLALMFSVAFFSSSSGQQSVMRM